MRPQLKMGVLPVTPGLKKDIDHLAILVYSTPKVVLLAVDLHEDFIDVESIAVATMFSL